MPTPLFPPANERVWINQGQTGDCYLLACMDCILNGDPKERELLKNMFKQNSDGSVEIRIPRTLSTPRFQTEKLRGKYGYRYDEETKQDIITIPKERLERFDTAAEGVQSNCLAVKILEHLTSYYHAHDWSALHTFASFRAHNANGRYNEKIAAGFVANVLGFASLPLDLDDLINLKTMNPQQQVYVEMRYGQPDQFGNIHGAHALRIEKVEKDPGSPGGYKFTLVNPWNTDGPREVFSLEELRKRQPALSLISSSPEQLHLNKLILSAINEKTRAMNGDREQAISVIKTGLAQYYLTGDASYVTRSNGLRDYLLTAENGREMLKTAIDQNFLETEGVTQLRKPAVDSLRAFVQSSNHGVLSNKTADSLLQLLEKMPKRDLYEGLYRLSQIYPPEFADQLIRKIQLVDKDFVRFAKEISREKESQFTKWVAKIQESFPSENSKIPREFLTRIDIKQMNSEIFKPKGNESIPKEFLTRVDYKDIKSELLKHRTNKLIEEDVNSPSITPGLGKK